MAAPKKPLVVTLEGVAPRASKEELEELIRREESRYFTTARGEDLDRLAALAAFWRRQGEDDDAFRARILKGLGMVHGKGNPAERGLHHAREKNEG
jgi:hypothetical protein